MREIKKKNKQTNDEIRENTKSGMNDVNNSSPNDGARN